MRRVPFRRKRFFPLRLFLLWGLTALLAVLVNAAGLPDTDPSLGLAERFFGSARVLIGQRLILEADRYYHQGVGHSAERQPVSRLLLAWSDAIAPREHVILEAQDLEEIMPWFRLATQVDPENVEAYVTASYWFIRAGRPDRAQQALDEALRNHPGDGRILVAMGHAYRDAGLSAAADRVYREALARLPEGDAPRDRAAALHEMELLMSLGALNESRGQSQTAIEFYQRLLDRFPEHGSIAGRIEDLQAGRSGEVPGFWSCAAGCAHDGHAH